MKQKNISTRGKPISKGAYHGSEREEKIEECRKQRNLAPIVD
jgi:hypothetical protein